MIVRVRGSCRAVRCCVRGGESRCLVAPARASAPICTLSLTEPTTRVSREAHKRAQHPRKGSFSTAA